MNDEPSLTRIWLRAGMSAVFSMALVPVLSWAADPLNEAWVDQAPTVAQIFNDIQGKDLIDTRARQAVIKETALHNRLLKSYIKNWPEAEERAK